MYESGLKTLGLVEQVGCVTRDSTNEIVFTCFLCNVMQRECWMLCTLYKGRRTETPCNKDDYFHRQLSAAKQISSHNVNQFHIYRKEVACFLGWSDHY